MGNNPTMKVDESEWIKMIGKPEWREVIDKLPPVNYHEFRDGCLEGELLKKIGYRVFNGEWFAYANVFQGDECYIIFLSKRAIVEGLEEILSDEKMVSLLTDKVAVYNVAEKSLLDGNSLYFTRSLEEYHNQYFSEIAEMIALNNGIDDMCTHIAVTDFIYDCLAKKLSDKIIEKEAELTSNSSYSPREGYDTRFNLFNKNIKETE